jgi:hypothetical protein
MHNYEPYVLTTNVNYLRCTRCGDIARQEYYGFSTVPKQTVQQLNGRTKPSCKPESQYKLNLNLKGKLNE